MAVLWERFSIRQRRVVDDTTAAATAGRAGQRKRISTMLLPPSGGICQQVCCVLDRVCVLSSHWYKAFAMNTELLVQRLVENTQQ